jgi:hypothetical protein
MKNNISKFILILVASVSFSAAADAQFVVKIRPMAPVIRVRPFAPSPRHVWVAGEYAWRGGQYVYTDGYWAVPPAPGRVWIEGHWKMTRRGWVWKPGHWAR